MRYLVLLLVFLLFLTPVSAASFQSHNQTFTTVINNNEVGTGWRITAAADLTLINASLNTSSTAAFCDLLYQNNTLIAGNASVSGSWVTFNQNFTAGQSFRIECHNKGVNYNRVNGAVGAGNYTNTYLNWTTGSYVRADNANFFNIIGVWVEPIIPPSLLTVQASNLVNGTTIAGLCVQATNGTAVSKCNVTGTTVTFNDTELALGTAYDFSGYNLSGGTYFNATNNSQTFTAGVTVRLQSFQALLNLSAYRLFLNTSITTFNASNGLVVNNTATAPVLLPANNGTNTLIVNVTGNYTKTITCTVNTPLSTPQCNATGIYDNHYTIGASFNGAGISTFNASVTNSTFGGLLHEYRTSNGSIVFPLLQGYYYSFLLNSTAHSIANVTVAANASTQLYNFSLLSYNTFELNFYNESSNSQLTNVNISVQIISDLNANNYTTSNGTLTITALTPEEYTIVYWREASVPREYYVTLTNQSYNNISLYLIDSGVSDFYLPILLSEQSVPVGDAKVQLLRYYILTSNTGEYRVVEMAKTDTNGQAVLRVVPNTINYKLLFTKTGKTLVTAPTKFTATTNTYTINLQTNPLASLLALPSVSRSITYNNATMTYTFTWADSTNTITQGCLIVDQTKLGVLTTVLNQCTSASTGSIIYTINDTNQTSYSAVGTLSTNNEFSTFSFVGDSVSFLVRYSTFGLVGVVITLMVFITFVMLGVPSGSSGVLIGGFFALLAMGVFGFIAYTWTAIIGVAIIIGIMLYKVNS